MDKLRMQNGLLGHTEGTQKDSARFKNAKNQLAKISGLFGKVHVP